MITDTRVAVVIPNFNGEEYIAEAIDSLLDQTLIAKIIVIENASTDKSAIILKSYGEKITVLTNEKNLGFAGGVNTGITYAINHDYDMVALFNNDAVAASDWLAQLVEVMYTRDEVAIVTGQIQLSGNRTIDSTGEFYTTWGLPYPRGRNLPVGNFINKEDVFGASGGASLYRIKALHQIGMFDDTFFAYYEDTDVSFRAQLMGWKVVYTPKAITTHRQGETSKFMVRGFTVYQTFKNLPMLFTKNVPRKLLLPIGARFYFAYCLIFAKAVLNGKGWPAARGVWAAICLIPHSFRERRHIQRNIKVSADYIKQIITHDLPPDQTGLRKLRNIFTRK